MVGGDHPVDMLAFSAFCIGSVFPTAVYQMLAALDLAAFEVLFDVVCVIATIPIVTFMLTAGMTCCARSTSVCNSCSVAAMHLSRNTLATSSVRTLLFVCFQPAQLQYSVLGA